MEEWKYMKGNDKVILFNRDGSLNRGEIFGDDSPVIDDEIRFKEGIDTRFMDLMIKLYKPFLNTSYKKARYRYTALSKHKYHHPVGFIAVDRTTAIAQFIEIALIPDLKEKYYAFLTLQELFQTLPYEKYGWTADKANYPSIRLLEKLGGGFYENTVNNKKRIKAEGFFRVGRPVSKKMQDALQQLKPEAREKFRDWLGEFNARKKERQALQRYLEEYEP
jgi:hypothetical protein